MKIYSFKMAYSGESTIYIVKAFNQEEAFSKLQENTNLAKRLSDWEVRELDKEVNFIS